MSIEGLQSVPSKAALVADSNKKTLGKNDFLKMLVAQLQAQDPLNPMDSTGFTAQLAQFSSLEQLQNINANLASMKNTQRATTNAKSVDFIGKVITASGNNFALKSGEETSLNYSLEQDAESVYLKIYDLDGNFVQDLELGAQASGKYVAGWDGRNFKGQSMPSGRYSFEVMAVDSKGDVVPSNTYTSGEVSGVNFKDGQANLLVDGQQIALGDVVQVMGQN